MCIDKLSCMVCDSLSEREEQIVTSISTPLCVISPLTAIFLLRIADGPYLLCSVIKAH